MCVEPKVSPIRQLGLVVGAMLAIALLAPGGASALSNGDPCGPMWTEVSPPTASFTVAPASVSTNEAVGFDAHSSQPGFADMWTFVSADNACEATSTVSDSITSYTWDFGDGTPPETDAWPQDFTIHTYTKAKPGGYNVTLTVTEANCQSGPGAHCFTNQTTRSVIVLDQPPTASFTTPANALTGHAVSFDASGSADPDGTIASYHWDFGDGQTQDTTSVTTSHTYGSSGPKSVTLTVADDSGSTGQANHTVSVSHLPPVASFTAPKSVRTEQVASFDASASSDPDGRITSYRWDFGDGNTQTTTAPGTSHSFRKSGTWAVTLTVTDDSASSGLARHAVIAVDRPPTASFTARSSLIRGRVARFDASGSSDPDGTIASYRWDFGDGKTQTTTGPKTSHTYSSHGRKTVRLTVTDDSGNTSHVQHTINVPASRCIVPPLVGKRLAEGRKLLVSANCRLGAIRHRHTRTQQRGRVIRQAVKPGAVRPAGRAVAVTVGN